MRLNNKVALITGGSMGIGQAISIKFAQEGARVAIAAQGQPALQETEEYIRTLGGEVLTIDFDIQDKSQIEDVIAYVQSEWGTIDILVNNAGICNPAPFLEITEEEWDRHLNINLKGTFLFSQKTAAMMVNQQVEGVIINMSSVNGLAAEVRQAHYNTSKGGMNVLTMSMALELAEHGIRVNALCPGFIETRLTKPKINNPYAIREYLKTIPIGRVGQPEDIADAALFLASHESRYMTGQCLVVDGGQLMKLS